LYDALMACWIHSWYGVFWMPFVGLRHPATHAGRETAARVTTCSSDDEGNRTQ
jgi:hypothetical protein